jgi:signal transduction histidine kinase
MPLQTSGFLQNPLVVSVLISLIALIVGYAVGAAVHSRKVKQPQPQIEITQPVRKPLRTENTRLQVIYNLIVSLSESLNYRRILDHVLDLSANILGGTDTPAEKLVSAVLLFSQRDAQQASLVVGSARRWTPADTRLVLPGNSGMLGALLDNPEPILLRGIKNDPELFRVIALRACQSFFGLPLRSGLETYGVLLFAHPDPTYFKTERRELLEIIGRQASIAIHNAQLYQNLEDEKNHIIEIQEEARKKLARDLHDGPTQSVSAIAMRVNFARRLMERDSKAGVEELVKVEDMARRTTKEIRHMLFTLRPLVLESQGLTAALEAMAEKMLETYNQKVTICSDPKLVQLLEVNKQAVIFNIAEEAVNNARKHAQAAMVYVRLSRLEEEMGLLEIEDTGVGFNLGEVDALYEKRGSLGLVNMRERAELVNGILSIDSAEGKGTRVRLVIPLSEEATDRLRRGK